MRDDIQRVVEALLVNGARKATLYAGVDKTVKASRPLYNGRFYRGRGVTVVLTIGKPNFEEREFIAKCKKAGEPFPVKKIQLKFPPKRKPVKKSKTKKPGKKGC